MQFIQKRPAISILFILLLGMLALEISSLTWSDPLLINAVFLVYMMISVILTGIFAFIIYKFLPKLSEKSTHWLKTWLITAPLALVMIFTIRVAIGSTTISKEYAQTLSYNYPHFNYGTFMDSGLGQLAGSKVNDFALEDLNGNQVQLSDLYQERPIVIEFGSYT